MSSEATLPENKSRELIHAGEEIQVRVMSLGGSAAFEQRAKLCRAICSGRVTGSEPHFSPALHVPKVLVKPEKMEISSQRTGGPSDWLQLCTFFGEGFAT